MNAIKLFLRDGEPSGTWYCEKCRLVFGSEDLANRCCTCIYCGKVIEGMRSTSHSECFYAQTNRRYDEQLTKATEVGPDYMGFVYCERGGPDDGYAQDIDSMAEWWADQIANGDLELNQYPEFVLACTPKPPRRFDTSDLLDKLCDGGYEDMCEDVEIPDGLEELLKKFNDINANLVSWQIDHTRKVKMPPPPNDRHQEELTGSEMDLAADLNNPQENNS